MTPAGFQSSEAVKSKVQEICRKVLLDYNKVIDNKYFHLSPMSISTLLHLLQDLRSALDSIFELPERNQEQLAWLVLNVCKLLLEIGEPLIWLSCGKYVAEYLLFAGVCLDSIINLSTSRHVFFRTKLYCSAFTALLSNGSIDEARALVVRFSAQIKELREREEVDPPIPKHILNVILQAETDIAILRGVISFWKDSDFKIVNDPQYYGGSPNLSKLEINPNSKSFAENCLQQCIYIQQLTAANTNEAWKKRSSHLLKAFSQFIESNTISTTTTSTTATTTAAAAAASTTNNIKFSNQLLLDIITIAMFDAVEGIIIPDFLQKIWKLVLLNSENEQLTNQEHESPNLELNLLQHLDSLVSVSTSTTTDQNKIILESIELIKNINNVLYCDFIYKRRTLLRRISYTIWCRHLYPQLQIALSSEESSSSSSTSIQNILEVISPSMMNVLQTFDIVGLDDPIFLSSFALITSHILRYIGNKRSAIGILHRAIDVLENYRASRVDFYLHQPDDSRDIHALQHLSFSTQISAEDWFHSNQRLGAHAFAGYSIFGAGSTANRMDQALAELHTDLLVIYFRTEIEYGIEQKELKFKHKKYLEMKEEKAKAIKGKTTTNNTSKDKNNASTATITAAATATTTTTTKNQNTSTNIIIIANLPCINVLKAYCNKSGYSKSLLFIEMARAENSLSSSISSSSENKLNLLKEALEAIEDASTRELLLRETFKDLTLITTTASTTSTDENNNNNNESNTNKNKSSTSRYPLVLSRSHKSIYITPVITSSSISSSISSSLSSATSSKHHSPSKTVSYYRILAREEGTGMNISIANNTLSGCEIKIPISHYISSPSPSKCAIPITNLRRGERYVFAVVAYNENDKVIGEISSTTPIIIEAVNPLPIPLLLSYFCEVAAVSNMNRMVRTGASKLLSMFFINPSIPSVRSMTKGMNLFFTQEPVICMLTIHQSSDVILTALVQSYLTLESPSNTGQILTANDNNNNNNTSTTANTSTTLHWNMRRSKQIELILRIRKTAVMINIACQVNNFELIVRCAALGYELSSELLKLDELQLSVYLQHPLIIFAAALQTIPLRFWNEIEHNLYTVLLHHISRCSILNYNTTPANTLLLSFHNEVPKDIPHIPIFNSNIQAMYAALLPSLKLGGNILSSTNLESQMQSILNIHHDPKIKFDIWSLTSSQRLQVLKGVSASLVGIPGAPVLAPHIDIALKEEPPCTSALLQVYVHFTRELVDTGNKAYICKLFSILPIYEEYLAPPVKQVYGNWSLNFITKGDKPPPPLPDMNSKHTKETKGSTSKDSKNKDKDKHAAAAAMSAAMTDQQSVEKVPRIFSREENLSQLFELATLTSLLSTSCFSSFSSRNYYPESEHGPLSVFNPRELRAEAAEGNNIRGGGGGASLAQQQQQLAPPLVIGANEFITYSMAAFSMFLQTENPVSSVSIAINLWTYIIDEWYTPRSFAEKFNIIRRDIQIGIEAFLSLLEKLKEVYTLQNTDIDIGLKNKETLARFASTSSIDIKEFLYLIKDFLPFILQVLWYYNEQKDVVDFGIRILQLYIIITPEYSKNIGEICIPLILESQEQIIYSAENMLSQRKNELELFISDWEEAQRKIRKKKMRIARIEKSEEELKFDSDRSNYQDKMTRAEAHLNLCIQRLEEIKILEREFNNLWSTQMQMLMKVRTTMNELLSKCKLQVQLKPHGENDIDYSLCLTIPNISEKFADVIDLFDQLANVLRERRDAITLMDALKDQGDLLLLFGKSKEARSVWNDAMDGLFSVLDSCNNWKTVVKDVINKLDTNTNSNSHMIKCTVPAIVILGKLSKFCCNKDYDMKIQYCRMAAELCRIPFMESIGHPVHTSGFAAYVCRDLGGSMPFILSYEKLSPYSLHISCIEIIKVLIVEKQYMAILPIIVLLEHYHAMYTIRSDKWLQVRLYRIQVLILSKFFAEAASMLSSIHSTILSIEDRSYSNPFKMNNSSYKYKSTLEYDSHENGLDFFQMAPYFNHLPPHDERNKHCIDWIKTYHKKFIEFSNHFIVKLPLPKQDKFNDDNISSPIPATSTSTEVSKKQAGKDKTSTGSKNKKVQGSIEDNSASLQDGSSSAVAMTIPMFSHHLEHCVAEVCAEFLITLAETSQRLSTPYHNHVDKDNVHNESQRQVLLKRFQLLKCRLQLAEHEYTLKTAQNTLEVLIMNLKNIPSPPAITTDSIVELSQIWFGSRDLLLIIIEKYGNFNDVVYISTQCIYESSSLCSGSWSRRFLIHRSIAYFKLGKYNECKTDCDIIIQNYENNASCIDNTGYIRILLLQASLIRQSVLNCTGSKYITAIKEACDIIRQAKVVAESISHEYGFIDADVNYTFDKSDTMVMSHVSRPPLLHNLSVEHDNYPPLSIPHQVQLQLQGIDSNRRTKETATTSTTNTPIITNENENDEVNEEILRNNYKYTNKNIENFRLGPIDSDVVGTYTPSEYANIYLDSVRVLVICHTALCTVLDDIRCGQSNTTS
eukprot:gene5213-10432_t